MLRDRHHQQLELELHARANGSALIHNGNGANQCTSIGCVRALGHVGRWSRWTCSDTQMSSEHACTHWAVAEEDTVRVELHDLRGGVGGWHHGDAAAEGCQAAQDVRLDPEVVGNHLWMEGESMKEGNMTDWMM